MVERTDWDVIVIGGGPAGSTVARYVAEGGKDVLVIDGRDSIGSPLQCGELVPSNEGSAVHMDNVAFFLELYLQIKTLNESFQ